MQRLRDLEPRFDPKGGSPKTPIPIPVSDYQGFLTNGNGTIWKVATSGIAGLFIGMVVAWFTALQNKGVSQRDMQEYVDKFSPYSHDKEALTLQQSSQDQKIGELAAFKDRIFDRLTKADKDISENTRDISDHDKKIKLLTDYIEAQKFPKK